jgi:hypothetical protein
MKKMRPGLPALLVLLVGLGWVAACQRTTAEPTQTEVGFFSVPATTATPSPEIPVITPLIPLTRGPDEPLRTPTPDAPHLLPTPRTAPDDYVVRSGDTLARIAQRYGGELPDDRRCERDRQPEPDQCGAGIDDPAAGAARESPGFQDYS